MTNEELVMAIQSGTGDKRECLEQLYLQNYRMIRKIINRYSGIEDKDDLQQEAYFGIVKAAELWDPEVGAPFLSYAIYWIRQTVRRYIDNCGAVIRVPIHRRAILARYSQTLNSYRMKFGRDPSEPELCSLMDLTPEQLEDLKRDAAAVNTRSLSAPIGDEDGSSEFGDTIADTSEPYEELLDKIQREELAREIWDCVDSLKAQQASVIRGRYKDGKTLKECGNMLGVTPGRVQRVEFEALRQLRTGNNSKRLRAYLTDAGAYNVGLHNTGRSAFEESYSSSQEVAMMRMEQLTGMSLYGGKELIT